MNTPKRYENVNYDDIPEKIKELLKETLKTRKGIFIHGSVGTGKTHILWAIDKKLSEIKKQLLTENKVDDNIRTLFFNTPQMLHDIRKEYGMKGEGYDTMDLAKDFGGILFLDDIGAEKLTDWVLETFYLIINARYENMRPTIFTSNLSIAELADKIGDRTTSRIVEMCEVYELKGNDRRILKGSQPK